LLASFTSILTSLSDHFDSVANLIHLHRTKIDWWRGVERTNWDHKDVWYGQDCDDAIGNGYMIAELDYGDLFGFGRACVLNIVFCS